MTDNEQDEVLNTGEIIEREEIGPPRRRPGRPRKIQSAEATFDGDLSETKPKRGRRASKLTGDDVTKLVCASSSMIVLSTGHPHWQIVPEECKPFAAQLADIFNKIPTRYVRAFVDFNGYAIVAMGLYNVYAPRMRIEAEMRRQERMETQRDRRETLIQQEHIAAPWDIPTTTQAES